VALQHHDGAFIMFPLVSTRALYLWLLNCAGITLEPSWALFNVSVNLSAPSVHQGAPDRVAPHIGSTKPIVTLIILPLRVCILRSVTLLDLNMTLSALKDTAVVLSHGLVLTSWRAWSNCNLVLNYAGSPRRFLRWKLQDGRRLSSSEFTKRPMCNIHQNGWRRYATEKKGVALGVS
jgi:hypothetical protein